MILKVGYVTFYRIIKVFNEKRILLCLLEDKMKNIRLIFCTEITQTTLTTLVLSKKRENSAFCCLSSFTLSILCTF